MGCSCCLSPARMRMEQGRRRTGCCSWMLNGKPLSLVDCFHVTHPWAGRAAPAAGTSPCWPAQSQGKWGTKGFGNPWCPLGRRMEDEVPSCAWGPFQCGLGSSCSLSLWISASGAGLGFTHSRLSTIFDSRGFFFALLLHACFCRRGHLHG